MTRVSRRRFIQISAASLAFPLVANAKPAEWSGYAFGGDVSIKLYSESDNAKTALENAVERMRVLEKRFSIYDPASEVARLNDQGKLKNPSEDLSRLLSYVDLVHEKTDGLFDPTVQRIFEAKAQKIPYTVLTAASSTGWQRVHHDRKSISLPSNAMGVTLNGIAQGFITDEVQKTLAEDGFKKALVNIGEYAGGDRSYKIGVARHDGKVFNVQEIRNEAIATSSPDGYRFPDGSSHIISPDGITQEPVWNTVSVVADKAAIADGFSTALVLARDLDLASKLKREGLVKRIILQDVKGRLRTV